MNDQKPAMPPGFGESEKPANRSSLGAPVLVSAVVAALVSAVVAFGVGRAGGSKGEPAVQSGADPSRLTVLEAQQAKFDERLTAVEFKAPAPASSAVDPEQRARAMLEARVAEGGASSEELKMLRAICRHQGDEACVDRMSAMIHEDGGSVDGLPARGFDRASAVRALTDAAAVARVCGRFEGRDVRARVAVYFEASGGVSSVEIIGEEPRNERARKCLQTVFREAKTTPFEGGPVKVVKSAQLVVSSAAEPAQPKREDLEF